MIHAPGAEGCGFRLNVTVASGALATGPVPVVTVISPDISVPLETAHVADTPVPAADPQEGMVGVPAAATNTLAERAPGTDTSGVSVLGKWTNLSVLLGLLTPLARTFCTVQVSVTDVVPFQACPMN
jgi:hypothetical protein